MATATQPTDLHRWTLDEYHQLIEAGGFDEDARVELIDGWIVDMGPKTREHELAIMWLNRHLTISLEHPRYAVGVGAPLTLATSEPEPDLIVIEQDAPRPYHAGTAALVIEVAVSSQRRDLRVKPSLYAAAGVPVYWVIDLDHRRAVVHTEPGPGGYAQVAPAELLTAPHIGLEPIRLGDLLAAAGR